MAMKCCSIVGRDDGKHQSLAGVIVYQKLVPKKYLNFIKAAPVNYRFKVARFEQPIVSIKKAKHPKMNSTNKKSTRYKQQEHPRRTTIVYYRRRMIMFFASQQEE